jgi:hypothetical protein
VPTSGAVDVSCGCQPELPLRADPALLLHGFLLLALGHTVRRPRSLMGWTPGGAGHHLPLTSPACLGRRTTLGHAASPLWSRHAVRGALGTVFRLPPARKARAGSLGARGRTSTPSAGEACTGTAPGLTCGRAMSTHGGRSTGFPVFPLAPRTIWHGSGTQVAGSDHTVSWPYPTQSSLPTRQKDESKDRGWLVVLSM